MCEKRKMRKLYTGTMEVAITMSHNYEDCTNGNCMSRQIDLWIHMRTNLASANLL